MLCLAAHLAALAQAAPAPPSAVRAQPPPRTNALPEARALLPLRAEGRAVARLEALLERFDVIEGGIAWKMRW
jgi:hypothetical protein